MELSRIKKIAKRVKKRLLAKGIVLMYHRIADIPSDPWALCVSTRHFREQMEVLKAKYRIMGLKDLMQLSKHGFWQRNTAFLTFDDGYVDNLINAKPILDHYRIPATFFIPTAAIGSQQEYYWDELERILLKPGTFPKTLRLNVNGTLYTWDLGEDAAYTEEQCQKYRHWRAFKDDPPPTLRHALYRSLYPILRGSSVQERQSVLEQLRTWADSHQARSSYLPMTWDQVRCLCANRLFEIGAHTVNHVELAALPLTMQEQQIEQSKTMLEDMLGTNVKSFAYPYGSFTLETVPLVRKFGFSCALTVRPGTVQGGMDFHQIPRHTVLDWDGREFKQKLYEWFNT